MANSPAFDQGVSEVKRYLEQVQRNVPWPTMRSHAGGVAQGVAEWLVEQMGPRQAYAVLTMIAEGIIDAEAEKLPKKDKP